MKQFKYHFDKSSKKFNCPQCGKKRFVKYVETETGHYADSKYGRCDRQDNCGYKLYPNDNSIVYYNYITPKPIEPSFIEKDIFQATLTNYELNPLVTYLINHYNNDEVNATIDKYKVGTSKMNNGATIFWQMDNTGNIRTGKIMAYDITTGKRIKDKNIIAISWVHYKLKKAKESIRQCLFGLQLFNDNIKQVAIVESEKTAIPSLKIAFNNVFGYYIEVRNTHRDKVPEEWIRKQTLVNAERYITEELKEYETKILGAEEKIQELERQLFLRLIQEIIEFIEPIQQNAKIIAQIDCLLSFAVLAISNNYIRPIVDQSTEIEIKNGRHPVIEKQLPIGEEYIANDVVLNRSQQQIIMITGPNMSGKSAILRQTALIVLLAQMGSYVPAQNARIGVVDKIFTRVGASDNISMGESTFMVEMNETASILNNISDRSLVLLDEIGRGTSTYDGISIAWAIAEYLHEHPSKAKTLFATHYHELNEMTVTFERIKNFNVSVKELKDTIVFLRKLVSGGSNHSFGIHVAKLAGMPNQVIHRASKILKQLEKNQTSEEVKETLKEVQQDEMQLSFFQLDDPLLEDLREEILTTNLDALTPIEALMKLNEIKRMLIKK